MLSLQIIYSGEVQGVGFRRHTASIAKHHSVYGFVRNLSDGTVELRVEGEEAEVQRFLAEIDQVLAFGIQGKIVSTVPYESYSGFEIRR